MTEKERERRWDKRQREVKVKLMAYIRWREKQKNQERKMRGKKCKRRIRS